MVYRRNNGFLNMIGTIKRKALELESGVTSFDNTEAAAGPEAKALKVTAPKPTTGVAVDSMKAAIMAKTKVLKPIEVSVEDQSNEKEKRYSVRIVAACFDGLEDAKRQQLVGTVLRKEKLAAELSVNTYTPDEASM